MDCTYLGHSAFLVETDEEYLLFDYTKGALALRLEDKPLLVFASHRHGDHFHASIFDLAKRKGRTTFVLSSDIPASQVPSSCHVRWMGPYEENMVDHVAIRTLKSTDEGVAFIVVVAGKTLYFAGDLNHWHWEGERDAYNRKMASDYHAQLKLLPKMLDVAFVPVDPRLGAFYNLGAKDLVAQVQVDTLVPMHFWGDDTVCVKLQDELKGSVRTILHPEKELQTWRNI
ncbi:MAG: MBL fold metallo-hydrolase [Sphaerochaeta sp.]|uniref:MBL fold metallo-hydrolase n=1 Tax=Sphaerochaeta sp. TaxID=1972642 RepID=UPI003D110AC4